MDYMGMDQVGDQVGRGAMGVEEAKRFLLTPPPGPPATPRAGRAILLAAVAAAAGYVLCNPSRVRRLGGQSRKVLRSPMVKRALVMFVSSLAANKAAR